MAKRPSLLFIKKEVGRLGNDKLIKKEVGRLVNLLDAVLTTRSAYCLADFSLSPLFRRKWSSIYESRQDCRQNRNKLMKLYLKQIPIDESEYLTVAIDHTSYQRLESPTLKDRGYHHRPSAPGKVSIGQGYSTIAWIPEEKGSWALPIRQCLPLARRTCLCLTKCPSLLSIKREVGRLEKPK